MRLLTRCYACNRQYDVSHRSPQSQFRCRCSKVLTVPDVAGQSHDAAVVKCSACGGPRHGQEEACNYCGASFSLREQELHVICPTCFTRISARAKYCHSCATPIVVEQELGEASRLPCPVCDAQPKLVSRTLGASQTSVLECPSCAGIWISHGLFERAVRHHQQQAVPAAALATEGQSAKAHQVKMRRQEGPMYRKCPDCSTIMNRQNYARRSGIIIDVCREHGIWFDREELDAILEWLRKGGARDSIEATSRIPSPASRKSDGATWSSRGSSASSGWGRTSDSIDIVDTVSDLLFTLFR